MLIWLKGYYKRLAWMESDIGNIKPMHLLQIKTIFPRKSVVFETFRLYGKTRNDYTPTVFCNNLPFFTFRSFKSFISAHLGTYCKHGITHFNKKKSPLFLLAREILCYFYLYKW